jgi:hypothetical protein
MQVLESVGYYATPNLPAAPTANISVWLTDPRTSDQEFIKRLGDMNLPLAGRSSLVLMFTQAGRLGVVKFLEKNGAWNPYMHGDQWQTRITSAIESGSKEMMVYTASEYAREASAPFCVCVDKHMLLAAILALQPLPVAKTAIEAFGLKHVSISSADVAAIAVNKGEAVYQVKTEIGKLAWHHQKSLHLTVSQNNTVAASAYCCDHSAMVDNRTAFKGQFSNILIGYHGYKPADPTPRQVKMENVSGPFVLLGFVDESKQTGVEFYLVPTGEFSPYSRTVLKGRDHVLDAFSLLQIGAAACYAIAKQSEKSYRLDWKNNGCVHLVLGTTYALVAVHTIKSVEHAMATAGGHGFIDKLKEMILGDEEPDKGSDKDKSDDKDKEPKKTGSRHSSSDILKELERKFPPRVTIE